VELKLGVRSLQGKRIWQLEFILWTISLYYACKLLNNPLPNRTSRSQKRSSITAGYKKRQNYWPEQVFTVNKAQLTGQKNHINTRSRILSRINIQIIKKNCLLEPSATSRTYSIRQKRSILEDRLDKNWALGQGM